MGRRRGGGKQWRRVDAELGEPVRQRDHLGLQEAEQQQAQLVPDPHSARSSLQEGGDPGVQGTPVQLTSLAISRPSRLVGLGGGLRMDALATRRKSMKAC